MIWSLRITAVSSAMAALLLAAPLAKLCHSHGDQGCCLATSHCSDHEEHYHHHGAHEPHSDAPSETPSHLPAHDDCAVCHAVGMHALAAWQTPVELTSELESTWLCPAPQDAPQTVLCAYQQRGPPLV